MTGQTTELDNLIVRPATYEQWLQTHKDQWPSKNQGLSMKQYSAKEHHLCLETEFGSKNFHRWVLVPKDDPDTLDYASTCKSYTRPIHLSGAANDDPRRGLCHSIAAVFTPVDKRKKGYARRMMSLLHNEFSKDSILSVLYSDVGDFYANARQTSSPYGNVEGWVMGSSSRVQWSLQDPVIIGTVPEVRPLPEEEFMAVLEIDAHLLREEVDGFGKTAFAILPTAEQILCFTARCKFYEEQRVPANRSHFPKIDNWGCQIGEIGTKDWAFAIWSFDLVKLRIEIIRLRCSTRDQLLALVNAAQTAGKQQGMTDLIVWNLDPGLTKECGWTRVRKTSSLPAVAWYGDGPAPQAWLANERWASHKL